MVKNPPSNAEDMGSIPGQGTKSRRAAEQLSPPQSLHATTKTQRSQINKQKIFKKNLW